MSVGNPTTSDSGRSEAAMVFWSGRRSQAGWCVIRMSDDYVRTTEVRRGSPAKQQRSLLPPKTRHYVKKNLKNFGHPCKSFSQRIILGV